MSTPSQQRPVGSQAGQPDEPARQEGAGAFRRSFFTVQAVFLLFLLIASINEVPSASIPVSTVPAATQMAMVAGLWVLTDVAALAVHAVHVVHARGSRTRR